VGTTLLYKWISLLLQRGKLKLDDEIFGNKFWGTVLFYLNIQMVDGK